MKLLRKLLTIFVVVATLVAGVLFALQNKTPIPLDILVYTFEPQSLALWVLFAFALGGVLGMVVSAAILVRTSVSLASCRRQLESTMVELSKLRSESSVVATVQ
jgi:lipopolysaccharide assembly protein A